MGTGPAQGQWQRESLGKGAQGTRGSFLFCCQYGARHGRRGQRWSLGPQEMEAQCFHGHRPAHTRASDGGNSPTWMESLGEGSPRGQSPLPFLSQENIQQLNNSVLTKENENEKTQEPNNKNDQAANTRHFLIFFLKVSPKHLCLSLSLVSIKPQDIFPCFPTHLVSCVTSPHRHRRRAAGMEKRGSLAQCPLG